MPNNDIEKKLWEAADELRANSKFKSTEYATPVLGLIFLRFADYKFSQAEKQLQGKSTGRKQITKSDYQAMGVMSLSDKSRFSKLINLPESADIGKAINDAMKAIETDNEELRDVLPKNYQSFEKRILIELLKILNSIPMDIEGDTFGKIYEFG
jgi:type I restriction enzyme M protein